MNKTKKDLEIENQNLRKKLYSPFTIINACPFSSRSFNGLPTRKCSHSGGPNNCGKCRVAAEWEECYG